MDRMTKKVPRCTYRATVISSQAPAFPVVILTDVVIAESRIYT